MKMKGRNTEKLNYVRWIIDVAFLVDVTGHLNNLNREQQGEVKVIVVMYDSIKAFKVKL
jgi:hypothetical protein